MFICPTERYSLFADDWVRLLGQNSERGAATPVLRTAGSEGKRPRISINATHFRSSSPNQYDHYAGVWQRNPAVWLTAAFFIKSLLSCFIGFLDGPHSSVESVTKTNIGGNWRGGARAPYNVFPSIVTSPPVTSEEEYMLIQCFSSCSQMWNILVWHCFDFIKERVY